MSLSSASSLTPPLTRDSNHHKHKDTNGNPDDEDRAAGPLVTAFTSVKVDVDDHFAKALGDQWNKLKTNSSKTSVKPF